MKTTTSHHPLLIPIVPSLTAVHYTSCSNTNFHKNTFHCCTTPCELCSLIKLLFRSNTELWWKCKFYHSFSVGPICFLLQPKKLSPAQSITSSSDVTITSRIVSFNVKLVRPPSQQKPAVASLRFGLNAVLFIFSLWMNQFALKSSFIKKHQGH